MVKNPSVKAGDAGWIPGLGRSPGGGNGNPLQYSFLENPMDRGAWRLQSNMTEHASDFLSTGVYWVCWWMVNYVIYSKAADPEEPHEI